MKALKATLLTGRLNSLNADRMEGRISRRHHEELMTKLIDDLKAYTEVKVKDAYERTTIHHLADGSIIVHDGVEYYGISPRSVTSIRAFLYAVRGAYPGLTAFAEALKLNYDNEKSAEKSVLVAESD